jgi:hypothetical protein
MFIHIKRMIFAVGLAVLLNSCATHGFRPGAVPLEDKHLADIPRGKGTVTVMNVTESKTVRFNACLLEPPVYTDLKHWGEDICSVLKNALERLGYTVSDSGEKLIQIRVTRSSIHVRFFYKTQIVLFETELGDGNKIDIKVAKRKQDFLPQQVHYGAVMDAAYWILHNEIVQEYLKEGQVGEVMYK